MPQQTNWLDQYQMKEAASAPAPALGPVTSGANWLDDFAMDPPAPAGSVRVPTSFAMVNNQPVQEPRTAMDSAYDYFSEALSSLNPKTIMQGLGTMLTIGITPGSPEAATALAGIGQAHLALAQRAKSAFDEGDMTTGMRYAIPAMIPLLGPRIGEAQQLLEAGETAKGLGALTDVGLQLLGPKLASKALAGAKVKLPALARNPNPVDEAAVAAAQKAGVPVDAATATGNPYVRSAQRVAEHTSILGAREGQKLGAAQAEGLKQWGQTLAGRAHPSPATLETVGEGIPQTIQSRIAELHQEANQSYTALRAIEADPMHATTLPGEIRVPRSGGQPDLVIPDPSSTRTIPLAVDTKAAKAGLQELYTILLHEKSAGGLMGPRARAFTVLDRLMQMDDLAPLSAVDGTLSELKAITRKAASPDLRNIHQGAAGRAISVLESAVDATVTKAGPAAVKALREGRTAVRAKYAAADALKALTSGTGQEPVKIAGKLIRPDDTALHLFERVEKLAPQEMPKLARAYLDSLMEKATAGGGFEHAAALANDWAKLGPKTKQALFKDAAHVRELDHFFHISKQMARNPNTSGTAYVLGVLAHSPSLLLRDPVSFMTQEITGQQLAKFLHSPGGVKLLTRGLTVPLGNQTAARAAYGALAGRLAATTPAPVSGAPAGLTPAIAGEPSEGRRP